jgi:hypothetical protein
VITATSLAYFLCALISAATSVLLLRSWRRTRSPLVKWVATAFLFITASNVLLVCDVFTAMDLSIPRALLIAVGLAFLIYGVVWEEQA